MTDCFTGQGKHDHPAPCFPNTLGLEGLGVGGDPGRWAGHGREGETPFVTRHGNGIIAFQAKKVKP